MSAATMAASSSPVLSSNGGETPSSAAASTPPPPPQTAVTAAVKSPGLPTVLLQRSDPPKNLRGLNKPKCIQCGNVARSRCPFQSCKSCCSKAQNPCYIHVLKQNTTLADRGASANPPTQQQQQPSEVPPPGPSNKVSSFRQLSSTFAQFNNVHIPLRSRKPITRKEATAINAWRFAKLKEYKEGNIEAENEAFDRYMQNISLLEDIFDVNSETPEDNDSLNPPTTSGDKMEMVSEMKVKLRSNPVRVDKFRKRIQQTVDQGVKKLQKYDSSDSAINLSDEDALEPSPKAAKSWWAGKSSALHELNDRLNKARNEDDFKLCMQMRAKMKGQQMRVTNILPSAHESDASFLLKRVRTTEIGQDALNSMNSYFSSLEEIEDL